eukprot:1982918-Prymnesium_polylepis.2
MKLSLQLSVQAQPELCAPHPLERASKSRNRHARMLLDFASRTIQRKRFVRLRTALREAD